MKKSMDFLAGFKMTIVSGVFLAASLILMLTGKEMPVDPAWVTVVISGLPLLYLAITRLVFQRWISSALLISMAMVASIAINELFAAGEVAFIMAIGAILEDMTVARAKKGISKLISLVPQQGRKLIQTVDGIREEIVSVEHISTDDILRVLPGEMIPVDGIIMYGNTSVDQSVMTGESLPVDKKERDSVFCGTMNCYGSIDICATQVGKDSSLQKMIDMVKEAENKKAPMQKIVDKWATWLVPIALLIAIAAYIITNDIVRAVTVLVVFCPCALALATPTSIMAAIGQATKHGILIKSGEALECMGNIDCIAFDKTGTLTYGNLKVSDIICLDKALSNIELVSKAASVEKRSEHPLGKSIVQYAEDNGFVVSEVEDFQMVPGKGVKATMSSKTVICGNSLYIKENFIAETNEMQNILTNLRNQGKAAIIVAENGIIIGIIALSDTIRSSAKNVIEKLYAMNTDIVLLTGDNHQAAKHIANQVGIKNVRADLLPAQKVSCIEDLQKEAKIVCMIGDGVNDAPALKTAKVSIAMGSMGSDIAIDAADIALMSDNIDKIPYLKRLSNSTLRTIKGNITASMAINAVAIVLSVLGLLTPITGALVHNAGSVLVVLNAALLYDRNFDI
ncbi:heavy metal translocating P-type ATPase [Clostridium magnum]|uniref:Cd(2+)-exporting ATPase n=1 Tax=Clostridium magnum DSM 2767 TaxID=1121326 RepID=A0A161W265_9CLOT|nr:cation-translocating P-type ATPase [Clostridium magnum]KZL89280.1 putative copper-exporting P-type ATPase V [Clostridium magnum DSM 2767]SHI96189.1 copper-(or silver)-translocating P-type ATPase [Clostridium magnum DSM 2767]